MLVAEKNSRLESDGMERLTYFNDATGMYRLKPPIYTEEAVQVLAIYENLGTPKELRELKEKATRTLDIYHRYRDKLT